VRIYSWRSSVFGGRWWFENDSCEWLNQGLHGCIGERQPLSVVDANRGLARRLGTEIIHGWRRKLCRAVVMLSIAMRY